MNGIIKIAIEYRESATIECYTDSIAATLDLDATDEQIAEAVAQRFGLSINDVYDDAQRHGWPVKCDENVILTGCPVHVLGAVV